MINSWFRVGRQSSAIPAPDLNPIFTQVAPTIFAQATQTAQAKPTSTPTPQPTLTPTPNLPPNTDHYDPVLQPVNILWNPNSNVPLSPSIPFDSPNAQYAPASIMGYNLCGQIVLSMIAAQWNGNTDILKDIWSKGTGSTRDTTDAPTLLDAAIKTLPGKWSGRAYAWSQVKSEDSSQIVTLSTFNWSGDNSNPDQTYGKNAAINLNNMMRQNHYPIVLVNISNQSSQWQPLITTDQGVQHWVLVTGFSQQWDYSNEYSAWNWVKINNPYNNRVEYYPWKDFKQSMSSGTGWSLVEIWPEP